MQKFILTRAFYSVITIWLLVTIIFGAVRLTGDPSKMMEDAGVDADYEQRIKERWGLDDPVHLQYVKYIGNLLRGDFGTSFHDNLPVTDIYFGRLPNSLKLGSGRLPHLHRARCSFGHAVRHEGEYAMG